jgi:hypothetical protein
MKHILRVSVVVAAMLSGGIAHADLEITGSTLPSIKNGLKCPDNAIFTLPSGAEIRVLRLPGGTTHTMKGEYRGTLDGFLNPCTARKATLGLCKTETFAEGGTKGAGDAPTANEPATCP